MAKRKKRERDGLIYLDPAKVARIALRLGLGKTALADNAGVSRNTVGKTYSGKGIFASSALLIAEALGVEVDSLVDPAHVKEGGGDSEPTTVGEWTVAKHVGPWLTASNGLQFRVCDMRHRFVEGRRGRGKWYDLLGRDYEKWKDHLVRHAEVCERIGTHRNIAQNVSALPGSEDGSWWVVDRWTDGETLANLLNDGPYPSSRLPRLMSDIAEGMLALHNANIVFRELSPSRVQVIKDDERAILTDFELAKLTDGAPTVSTDWPDDPYQAPEVASGSTTEKSDLYSWARIFLHAATGNLPPKGMEQELLASIKLPKAVWKAVSTSLSPGPSDRPQNVNAILRPLRTWSKSTKGSES